MEKKIAYILIWYSVCNLSVPKNITTCTNHISAVNQGKLTGKICITDNIGLILLVYVYIYKTYPISNQDKILYPS